MPPFLIRGSALTSRNGIAMLTDDISSTLDWTVPVLILKMSPTPVHHGALAVARVLGRQGVPVYGIVEDGCTPLAVSRYLTKAFIWDRRPSDSASFVKEMAAIAAQIGSRAIVIPMDDLSAVCVAENAVSLAEWFIVPPVRPQTPARLANKLCLSALCAELAIPTARTVAPKCFDEVKEFVQSSRFPVVVKASEQWHPVNHAFCTKVIETREELFSLCERYDYQSERILIQEHIPGEDWIVHGYYNSNANVSLTFTGRKTCGYPNGAGSTAMGLSVDNGTLRQQSETLLKAVDYSGIIDMDWRRDSRDGQYRLLDCNPRVGQNFRMFENEAGIDVVLAQYLDLSGQPLVTAPQVDNCLFIVESFYILAMLRRLTPLSGSREKIIRPSHQVMELAWWSSDDVVPFFVMIIRVLVRLISRSVGALLYSPLRSWLPGLFAADARTFAGPSVGPQPQSSGLKQR